MEVMRVPNSRIGATFTEKVAALGHIWVKRRFSVLPRSGCSMYSQRRQNGAESVRVAALLPFITAPHVTDVLRLIDIRW